MRPRRDLRQRRHQIERFCSDVRRPHQRFRHHHPADPPPVMQKIFRRRIDHQRLRRELGRGHPPETDNRGRDRSSSEIKGCRRPAPLRSAVERLARLIVPVGLAGLPTSTPFSGSCGAPPVTLSPVRAYLASPSLDQHRLAAERGEDMAVRRIAGTVTATGARFEHRKKRQDKTADEPVVTRSAGIHRTAIRIAVVRAMRRATRQCRARSVIQPTPRGRCGQRRSPSLAPAAAGCPTSMCTLAAGRLDPRGRRITSIA